MYPKAYLYRRIVQAKLFIDQNFRKNINLDEIAEEASFSRFHFIRLFRKAYGDTPHQYLLSLRMREAEKLMEDPDLRIQDICFEIGFESVTTFTSAFSRLFGKSPKAYQNDILERKRLTLQEPLKTIPGCFAEKQFSRRAS
ncbi:MAG TPA: AraC family transcriptional regulator [Cyclobacteriaceae bacterium]|nr:AraC family transcriptional regulator [Cyclobacteriaceae bacterium]